MILSEKFRFVFIKGMKVAGTSVEMALSVICGANDIITPISGVDELKRIEMGGRCRNYSSDPVSEAAYLQRLVSARPETVAKIARPKERFFNHMTLAEVIGRYPAPLSGFRIVCVERSPYSKVLSWLNMKLAYQFYQKGVDQMISEPSKMRYFMDEVISTGAVLAVRNIDRYRAPDGRIAARAMRYETLVDDFSALLREFGATQQIALPHAKKGMLADGVDPHDFFRSDQIAKLNEMFAEEFEAFDYPML